MIHQITTKRGIDMVARLVLKGDRYGRDGCLTADSPMIEFYMNTEHEHNPWLAEMYDLEHDLYFISRYNLNTFLFGFMGDPPLDHGLCLEGSARQFDLEAGECRYVAAYLFMQLAEAQE
jgi:hypothetical protein